MNEHFRNFGSHPSLHPIAPRRRGNAAEGRRPTDVDRRIGQRIKLQREAIGMSQSDLAGPVGVTVNMISKMEKGKSRIAAARLQCIATALSVPIQNLFDPPEPARADAGDADGPKPNRHKEKKHGK